MNPDIAWGILIGAVGMIGLEAVAFVWLAVRSVRREYAKRRAATKPPGLRVVDAD
jgi:hypothetical protein